ncbi:hypothetical protein BA059_14815 [Mycolicibacterium sp. (ex Dasyatis americana)]|nr:hypothetical protein BA059_14815 [Mycolicibacterium sp. (ex Dasyatis americana)]
MTHHEADQIVTSIIDYEHALAVPQVSPFDPAWRYTRHADDTVSMLFDPGLNPGLYEHSRCTTHLVHMHEAAVRVTYHYPMKPCEGSSRVDLSQDGDVKAVFVADVTPEGAQVYVLSDTAQDDCDGVVPTLAPRNVFIGRDGRPIVRLSDIFTHALLHDPDGSVTYVEHESGSLPGRPDNFTYAEPVTLPPSPAQQFVQRLQFGTLTTDTCDLHLGDACGGPTILLVEHKGGCVLLWEVCEACYDTARETARAALQAALQVARAQVRHQGGNGNA